MGKHRLGHGDHDSEHASGHWGIHDETVQKSGQEPGDPRSVPDPEDPALIEPDRDAAERLGAGERESREGVHTDRDPEDDIHLASDHPQSGDSEHITG